MTPKLTHIPREIENLIWLLCSHAHRPTLLEVIEALREVAKDTPLADDPDPLATLAEMWAD